MTLGVSDEVRREVTLVELHTFGELELDAKRVGLFNRDGAVLADLVNGVGDDFAYGGVGGRDSRHLSNLRLASNLLTLGGNGLNGRLDGLFDAALETRGARAGGDVAQALLD